ncbi:Clostripain family protein [compost metagenome]
MGMVEVASQMQDSVSYFLGSQDNEPGEGWPYAHFLRQWAPKVDQLSAKEVAQLHAKEYLTAYSPGGVYRTSEVTMSAFDLSKISAYESAIRGVSTYLQGLNSADLTKARQAVSATKQFGYASFYDIVDYLSQLEKKGLSNPSFSALRQAHHDFVIANEQNQDQNTYGVSVWIATGYSYKSDAARYNALEFNKNSQWGSFLNILNK